MMRTCLVASALFVALTPQTAAAEAVLEIPAIPIRAEVMAAATGVSAESWACSPMVATPDYADSNARWRMTSWCDSCASAFSSAWKAPAARIRPSAFAASARA